MAAIYWDYNANAGTTGTASTTASSTTTYTVVESTATTTGGPDFGYCAPRTREIIVEHPADWTDEQHAQYVRMVNDEVRTGWRVTMLFKGGDILIADPNIEVRKMADFVPLLKARASEADRVRINDFFKANPA